jgi:hypothetical protein
MSVVGFREKVENFRILLTPNVTSHDNFFTDFK